MLKFDWDQGNVEHIALHGVSVADAEYVLSHPTLDLGVQDWQDEERYGEVGATPKGRILIVVTTWRRGKIRVVTAFDASNTYAERFRKLMVNR